MQQMGLGKILLLSADQKFLQNKLFVVVQLLGLVKLNGHHTEKIHSNVF